MKVTGLKEIEHLLHDLRDYPWEDPIPCCYVLEDERDVLYWGAATDLGQALVRHKYEKIRMFTNVRWIDARRGVHLFDLEQGLIRRFPPLTNGVVRLHDKGDKMRVALGALGIDLGRLRPRLRVTDHRHCSARALARAWPYLYAREQGLIRWLAKRGKPIRLAALYEAIDDRFVAEASRRIARIFRKYCGVRSPIIQSGRGQRVAVRLSPAVTRRALKLAA